MLQLERCARHVTALAVLLGITDTRAVTKTRTPGTKATGGGARDALEPLDTFQAATLRSGVGFIGYTVLDRPDCQYATRELDWMRMLCLTRFPVATASSNGSNRRRTCLISAWCTETQTGQARIHEEHNRIIRTAWTAPHRIQLLNSARRRSLKRRRRAVCNGTCGKHSCWPRLEWS